MSAKNQHLTKHIYYEFGESLNKGILIKAAYFATILVRFALAKVSRYEVGLQTSLG
jgi:hypothetical protein